MGIFSQGLLLRICQERQGVFGETAVEFLEFFLAESVDNFGSRGDTSPEKFLLNLFNVGFSLRSGWKTWRPY